MLMSSIKATTRFPFGAVSPSFPRLMSLKMSWDWTLWELVWAENWMMVGITVPRRASFAAVDSIAVSSVVLSIVPPKTTPSLVLNDAKPCLKSRQTLI